MKDSSPNNFDNEVQETEAEYGEEVVVQDDGGDDQSGDDEAAGGGDICGEELEGINGSVGGEMGMGKLARPGRCKQSGSSNEGLLNWEPFWVAT
jgi:hypothetical protein